MYIKKLLIHFAVATTTLLLHMQVTLGQTNAPSTTTGQAPGPLNTALVPNKPPAYAGGTPVSLVRAWVPQKPYTLETDVFSNARLPQEVARSTQYFDGLGRPLQTVTWKASPAANGGPGADIVSPQVYNAYGQEEYKYLPYAAPASDGAAASDGSFKTDPFGDQNLFYGPVTSNPGSYQGPQQQPAFQNEQYYYSHIKYEPSPLNRISQTFGPGNSWAGSEGSTAEKSVRAQYLTNTAGEVQIWSIPSAAVTYTAATPYEPVNNNIPTTASAYVAGTLLKTITIDEAGNTDVEYKDIEGRVVLKKVQAGNIAADYSGYSGFLCTYYIYDDLGLLRFVIPPKAVNLLLANSWSFSLAPAGTMNELCFRYEYDARHRQVNKKAPGKGWEYIVYDLLNRPVFIQDDNMRQNNQWQCTLYDNLDRPQETAMMYYNLDPVTLQTYVTQNTASNTSSNPGDAANLDITNRVPGIPLYVATNSVTLDAGFTSEAGASFIAEIDAGGNAGLNVNNNPVPPGYSLIPLTYTYYDNYSKTAKAYTTANNNKLDYGQNTPHPNVNTYTWPLPAAASSMTRSMTTGTKVRVIENAGDLTLGGWLETVTFYDDAGHTVQMQTDNYKGGLDIVTSLYNFTGQPVCTYTVHNNPAAAISNLSIKANMQYDYMGRLLTVYKNINDDANAAAAATSQRTVAQYFYDGLGKLREKKIGQKPVSGAAPSSAPLEDDVYSNNIRGWLKGINWNYPGPGNNPTNAAVNATSNKWFGIDLSYDWGFKTNGYNGDVAGQQWANAGDGATRAYGYMYDAARRLLYADFNQLFGSQWTKTDGTGFKIDFTVAMGTFNGTGISNNDAYDENGNILKMQQSGLVLNSSPVIDKLAYTYENGGISNKLRAVADAATQPAGINLGDFIDKNTTSDDYGYDKNGNLITDLNKTFTGNTGVDQPGGGAVVYTYLNEPYKITVNNGAQGTVTYIYDALGSKLEKRVSEAAQQANGNKAVQTTTTYLGAFVYQNNVLQYFDMEEGRIRPVPPPRPGTTPYNNGVLFAYDYVVKDHLGNTRAVLTDELQQDVYPAATLEGSLTDKNSAIYIENNYYTINTANVVPATYATGITPYENKNGNTGATDPPVNNNPNSNTTANSQYVYQLNGSGTAKTGLGITLKVMAGDVIDIWGKSYYFNNNTSGTNNNVVVTDIITGLLGAPTGAAAGKGATVPNLNVPGGTVIPSGFLGRAPATGDQTPNAGLNYIIFDDQFRYVSCGFSRVNAATTGAQSVKDHHNDAVMQGIAIPKNGYIYVYASNQSPVNVFFDNLQVIDTRGPLLEVDNYYPFGLAMAGINSQAAGKLEDKIKFQQQELQHEEFSDGSGLEVYGFKWRMDDPQTGRFWQTDPLAEKYAYNSPYAFSENRVTDGREMEGLEYVSVNNIGLSPEALEKMKNDDGTYNLTLGNLTFNNVSEVEYNNEEYFKIGKHIYYDQAKGWNTDGDGDKKSEWVYTDIQNFDGKTMHAYGWKDPLLAGKKDDFGGNANENCAALAQAQARAMKTNLAGGVVSLTQAIKTYDASGNGVALDYNGSVDYINQQLEAGKAVVVGVYIKGEVSGTDYLGTHHYVTITGRTSVNGIGQFLFLDNAVSNPDQVQDSQNRFRLVDKFKAVVGLSPNWMVSGKSAQLLITRVQKNQ